MTIEHLTLREWRKRKALSQDELAKAAGLTQYTVSQFELGKSEPRAGTIRKLCAVLGIEPVQLVFEKTPKQLGLFEGPESQGRAA